MAKVFWRAENSDVWHWNTNCSSGAKVLKRKGTRKRLATAGSGELCDECLSKQKKGTGKELEEEL